MVHMYGHYHSFARADECHEQEKQVSRSNYLLYRYNHEPVSSHLLRRDIPPILVLLFFLFLIIITLSQILVVHTSRYGANFSAMQKIQEELKLMDYSMEELLRDNVLPIDKWRLLFHIQTYLYRFEDIFDSFHNDSFVASMDRTEDDDDENKSMTALHMQQWIDPLLVKSNEILMRENSSDYLMKNMKRVQNRLKAFINHDADEHSETDRLTRKQSSARKKSKQKRQYCREQPGHLRKSQAKAYEWIRFNLCASEGRVLNENTTLANISLFEVETNYSSVRSGGQWSPPHCLARHRVIHLSHLILSLHERIRRLPSLRQESD